MYVSRPLAETDEEAQSYLHQSLLVPGWQFFHKVGNCQPARVVGYFSAQSVENNPTTHEGENQKGKEIHFYSPDDNGCEDAHKIVTLTERAARPGAGVPAPDLAQNNKGGRLNGKFQKSNAIDAP